MVECTGKWAKRDGLSNKCNTCVVSNRKMKKWDEEARREEKVEMASNRVSQ